MDREELLNSIKSPILKKFISADDLHISLLNKWYETKDNDILEGLNSLFKQFMLKAYLYSYIYKSIEFKSREVKRKHLISKEYEKLSLTKLDAETEENVDNYVMAPMIEYVDEIFEEDKCFWEAFDNERLIYAIKN